jgi:hypothetical protein
MNLAAFAKRVAAEWRLKLFFGGVVTCLFWAGYFASERRMISATVMPVTVLDRLIPFTPCATWIYVSQLVTAPVVAWMLASRRDVWAYCESVLLMGGIGIMIFWQWPTSVARPVTSDGGLYGWMIRFDTSGNACPSLHAAFGVFTVACSYSAFAGLKLDRVFVGLVWLSTMAVLASTLLTKQHVVIDLLAGVVLGGVASAWFFMRKGHTP